MKRMSLILILLIFPIVAQEEISFYAKKMQVSQDGALIELTGEALLQLDAFTLYAQSISIQGTTQRTLQAQTDVKVKRTQNEAQELTSNHLHYAQIKSELRAWGNVQFKDDNEEILITASSVTFVETERIWRFEGNVQMNGKDFSTQSHILLFHEEAQMLELHSQVTLIYDGQQFEAEFILFHLETKEITMEHLHRGTISL
ncbi:hypothetical protein [Entomospira culicis]|uniref:Organic solvent tolerance-like N-terminal domain-containing protein n=1 Tax=Entomospira culicis TaxID=2719989 RepID=A0A968GKW1_9SPIO|nr:hypothetical protein [Entomospira culicis]NIZ19395.1 hypothetical protein [Entomospira culicis]NIZ69700.1 hypothetical protein [Entomospira culicis]WDI36810.1 hypothetical protein PVA46_05650 [Entomospira culicis]WDI38439.1 hypothetical protein PVA47_05660 [Entomospira culicis]